MLQLLHKLYTRRSLAYRSTRVCKRGRIRRGAEGLTGLIATAAKWYTDAGGIGGGMERDTSAASPGLLEPVRAARFHHIILANVLQAVADPVFTLRELGRVSAPGGTAVVFASDVGEGARAYGREGAAHPPAAGGPWDGGLQLPGRTRPRSFVSSGVALPHD
jgi:hypothetical protein